MKKQLLSTAIAVAIAVPAQAAVLVGNYGASTTLGQVASPTTINSVRYNPAAGYIALDTKNGENLRFGYMSQLGGSVEFGEADNFETDVDKLMTSLDTFNTKLSNTQDLITAVNESRFTDAQNILDTKSTFANSTSAGSVTESATRTNAVNGANDVIDSANTVLNRIGSQGRLKTSFSASVPGMPVVFELPKVPGVLSVDASVGFVSLAGFISDPFSKIESASSLSNLDTQFNTNSQVVVKGGTVAQFGLGYSQPISAIKKIGPLEGELIAGVKANIYSASLTSVKAKVNRDDDKNIGDLVSDGLKKSKDSNAFGIDVGAIWMAKNYQTGLTLKNLNSPELEASLTDDLNSTSATEKVSLDMQATVDGAVFIKDRMFMLAGSTDLNKVEDLVGDEVQMLHVSGTFFPSNFLIPTLRVGYQKNLAGEELSALNVGAGLFRGMANIDVTYGLDTTEVDGSSISRQLGIQLSFEETF